MMKYDLMKDELKICSVMYKFVIFLFQEINKKYLYFKKIVNTENDERIRIFK